MSALQDDAAAATRPEPGSRMAMAIAALEASRGLLRHQMLPQVAADVAGAGGDSAGRPRWNRSWRRLRGWLRRWPAAELASEAVQGWWRSHPLRPVGEVLAAEWRANVVPVVHRHPVLTVTAAATLGALAATARPWRWPVVARGIAPLPSRVGHWLVAQLSSAPVQTALAALAVMAAQPRNPPPAPVAPDGDPAADDLAGFV